jgi:hypothetical protein
VSAVIGRRLAGLCCFASAAAILGLGSRAPASPASLKRSLECSRDADCGYDPAGDGCDSDPRSNRQPPLVDQGIVCYCDEAARRCAILRVPPVPCESNASCAVSPDPRPHPVAASVEHPHERGRACRDFAISTTCERTNICTMRRHDCPSPDGGAKR